MHQLSGDQVAIIQILKIPNLTLQNHATVNTPKRLHGFLPSPFFIQWLTLPRSIFASLIPSYLIFTCFTDIRINCAVIKLQHQQITHCRTLPSSLIHNSIIAKATYCIKIFPCLFTKMLKSLWKVTWSPE